MDEQTLIRAAQAGELSAFNQLVLHYQALAYNIAYRLLNDADAAADATQDGFIKAYRSLSGYRGGNFRSWLLRIISNTCYDQLRARQRRPTSSLDDMAVEAEHAALLADRVGEDAEQEVMRGELVALLGRVIASLPEDQRTTLVLADIEGFSYAEIAEVVGVELGTVKSRLSRARARVRDLLQEHGELLPGQYRLKDDKVL